jgi:dihydrofolate reductase
VFPVKLLAHGTLFSSMSRVTLIVAATTNNGIGQAGKLPWRLPQEMQYFARVTTGEPDGKSKKNAVVMGRVTWESIPRRFRPLPGRMNLVVSRQTEYELCVGVYLVKKYLRFTDWPFFDDMQGCEQE